jgi:hypothetical protein
MSTSRAGQTRDQAQRSCPPGKVLRWRRVRVLAAGAAMAAISVLGSLALTSHQESSAASLVGASAGRGGVGSGSSPAPMVSMPADMPGMDMSGSSPEPTVSMPADMPGMDMSGSSPAPTETPMPQDMPGMDMSGSSSGAAAHRPLAPVLGTFGGGTAAVLLTAGMMRRKKQSADLVKKAARISGGAKR